VGKEAGGAIHVIPTALMPTVPCVAFDCGSLVPTLMESELFGYVKGAFTGATPREGRSLGCRLQGGTVFSRRDRRLPA